MKKGSITRRKFLEYSVLGMAGFTTPPLTMCFEQRDVSGNFSSRTTAGRSLFSFDDRSIPWKENLKLTMTQADKYPSNPVIRRGGEGSVDEWAVQFYGSVIYHEGKYKLWYIAGHNGSLKEPGFSGLHVAYAESKDGIHWKKPNLGLVEYRGSRQNNLVRVGPSNIGGIHVIVIHEPEDPDPGRRFKMMLTVHGEEDKAGKKSSSTSIPFFSQDGFRWESPREYRFKNGNLIYSERVQIIPPPSWEQSGLFKRNGLYYLTGQVFDPQPSGKPVHRRMAVKRSKDLLHWDSAESFSFMRYGTQGKVIEGWLNGEQAHLPAAIWNRRETLLGVYGMWHGAKKWEGVRLDLGLLVSNDGVYFREPIPDHVFIRRGNKGEWDAGGLLQGQGFFNRGDKTFIYYGSWPPNKPSNPPRGGVGIATLRRDGFGYLSVAKKDYPYPAHFITRIIQKQELPVREIKITMNSEGLSTRAPLQVEILDMNLDPMPEYAGKNAGLVGKDGVGQLVVWPGGKGEQGIKIKESFSVKVTYPANANPKVYGLYIS